MQLVRNVLGFGLISALLLTSCSSKKEEQEEAKDESSVSAMGAVGALKEMAAQAEEMQKKGPVATVDFRALKDLLPADADGLPRKEATGEKNGTAGFTISTATGKYANADDSENMELTIVDGGGTPMMMGLAAWAMVEIDKETDSGYEKTATLGDNKSYEKYDNTSKDGELNLFVNKRFVVTAKGHGISMDQLKKVVEGIDLDKLASLK